MTSEKTIMVVDDDAALGEMLSIVLESAGYRSVTSGDGLRAIELFPTLNPDLVLLDVMLPGMNGIEVAKTLRRTSLVPIVMLTAKSDTQDVVAGLEAGADDYIPKPFKNNELLARIKARLRYATPANSASDTSDVEYGPLFISRMEHVAKKNGKDLLLTPMEFDLLWVLAKSCGDVLTRGNLLEQVWGYSANGDSRLVNVHIQRLRQKVEDDPENPELIRTVRGIGYKLIVPTL
jgi:two-component system response regulator MtrA